MDRFLHHFLLHIDRAIVLSTDEDVVSFIGAFLRPLGQRIQKHLPIALKVSVLFCGGVYAARGIGLWAIHWYHEHTILKKSYLSFIACQLLTTEIDQKGKFKTYVDKRMLFQKHLQNVAIIGDKYTQVMITKAAERTTPNNHFITANLSEGDSWRVLNSMAQELSSMAGVSHMCAHSQSDVSPKMDWYIMALMNPKYDHDVMREFLGGTTSKTSEVSKSTCKMRLVVLWEQELWDVVCHRIDRHQNGMETQRHERRWEMILAVAAHYKRHLGKSILKAAHEKSLKDKEAREAAAKKKLEEHGHQSASSSRGSSPSPSSSKERLNRLVTMDDFSNIKRLWKNNHDEEKEDYEVTMREFVEEAATRSIPRTAATVIFKEFDLDGDHRVSLHEVDEACTHAEYGAASNPNRGKVDAHLYRVNLPICNSLSLQITQREREEMRGHRAHHPWYDVEAPRSPDSC